MKLDRKILKEWVHQIFEDEFKSESETEEDEKKVLLGKKIKEGYRPMNKNVAAQILHQLGGKRFIAFTGAKNIGVDSKSLTFKIGRNSKSISHIKIYHNMMDLYDVEFIRVRGTSMKVVKKVNDVYAEDLQNIFSKYTGMATRF